MPEKITYSNSEEIWKDVLGYEGMYQVSNWGRVKSLKRKHAKFEGLRKLALTPDGYLFTSFSVNDRCVLKRIHRLVASAFISNPNGCSEVNHIDGDKQNNCAENLEWVSHSENMAHASKMHLLKGCKGTDNTKAKLNNEAAIAIYNSVDPTRVLSEKFGVSYSAIQRIRNGKYWKHKTKML
jgi:hypothetical protein